MSDTDHKRDFHCATHGWWNPARESGCPNCVVQLRRELAEANARISDERNRGLRLARAAYLVGTESNGISDNEWRLKDGRVVVADFPVDSFCVAMEELEAAMEPYVVNWQALDVFADPATCSHQWQDCYPLHGEVQTYCGKCCIAGPTRLQAPK